MSTPSGSDNRREEALGQWYGKATLKSLVEISHFLRSWLASIEGYRQRNDEQYLVELAVIEALTNIIRHAYPDRSEGEVRIFLRRNKDSIEIEIQDHGIPFDPIHFSPPDLDTPREEGYGVYLMKLIMNTICYERRDNKINCLHMKRDIPQEVSGTEHE